MGKYDQIHALMAQGIDEIVSQFIPSETSAIIDGVDITPSIVIKMDFDSKFKGSFWAAFDQTFCEDIAVKFSGMSPEEIDEAMMPDIMQEVTNMVTGNIMKKLSSGGSYNLSVPQSYTGENLQKEIEQLPENTYDLGFHVSDYNFKIFFKVLPKKS